MALISPPFPRGAGQGLNISQPSAHLGTDYVCPAGLTGLPGGSRDGLSSQRSLVCRQVKALHPRARPTIAAASAFTAQPAAEGDSQAGTANPQGALTVLPTVACLIAVPTLCGSYCCVHFTDEETEAWGDVAGHTCRDGRARAGARVA